MITIQRLSWHSLMNINMVISVSLKIFIFIINPQISRGMCIARPMFKYDTVRTHAIRYAYRSDSKRQKKKISEQPNKLSRHSITSKCLYDHLSMNYVCLLYLYKSQELFYYDECHVLSFYK